ncbi:MAG TPA: type I-U CRISPR-associated protein Csb2, partial [Dehalococcoidia bacterium]|nr:type I-U CRISPR-associated protein Csb2 [Dehalococcoidia bacterium]
MPIQEGRNINKTLVLDSFVATQPGEPMVAIWPQAVLNLQQQTTLSAILENLSYLGRGESWCTAGLVDSPPGPNCQPLESPVLSSGDVDLVRVLVPSQPLKLRDLCVETGQLRRQGHIDPPGTEWRLYSRRADCFAPQYRPESSPTRASEQQPTVVRYALSGPLLPLLTDTLRIAELMRRSAMSRYGRYNNEGASSILSGKEADGSPRSGHQHASYLPTDEDQDGRLDHLTVWAPAGLNTQEVDALARVDALNSGQGRPEIRLALLGYGTPGDFRRAEGISQHHSIFGRGRVWRSITPFVLVRHPKKRRDSPEDQLELELRRRSFPVPEEVAWQKTVRLRSNRELYPLEFYRWRRSDAAPVGGAYFFHLRFNESVEGPIALGYACHFGLGLFGPADHREVV